jgi:hypothetical protein
MKGWVFLLPTITKDDAEAFFPEHKVCQVPSGQGEGGHTFPTSDAICHMSICRWLSE